MATNLFKAFTPYLNLSGRDFRSSDFHLLEDFEALDPHATSWSSIGFINVQNDELFIDVQGAGFLAIVQYNERILPGAVQKEKIAERMADIESRQGRKPGKKEYAQIKDEVILELLPVALIKRKSIPVLFMKDRLFIFTTSAKRCDDVLSLLSRALPDQCLAPSHLSALVSNSIGGALTTLAKEGIAEVDDAKSGYFETTDAAVLKGKEKETIRVKDKSIGSSDVQALLKQDYAVTALGLDFTEGVDAKETTATIVINDKLVITRMVLNAGVFNSSGDDKEEADTFLATAWVAATVSRSIVALLIDVFGGLRSDEDGDAEEEVEDDDDEL